MAQPNQNSDDMQKEALKRLDEICDNDTDMTTKEGRERYARRMSEVQAALELMQRVLLKQGLELNDPYPSGWEIGAWSSTLEGVKLRDDFTSSDKEKEMLAKTYRYSRFNMLEEMTQSLYAINNPQHVMDVIQMTVEDFVPENEGEESLFNILLKLYEEAKEKIRYE